VAQRAGVSIGTLYQYFSSKDSLVAAVANHHIGRMLELLETQLGEVGATSIEEAARGYISTIINAYRLQPTLARVVLHELPRLNGVDWDRQLRLKAEGIVRVFLARHRKHLRDLNLDLAAFILVHAVDSVLDAALLDERRILDCDELADELVELVLRYLGARAEGSPATSSAPRSSGAVAEMK
jgi:AcrR family transcriptional regulator